MSKKMHAAIITHYRQPLPVMQPVPRPAPQPNDVLVKINAASINPIDLKTMHGGLKFLLPYQFPLIIGSDFAGTVVAVGQNVTAFQIGDAVYGRPRKNRIGTFAEYLAVDQADIALKPRNLSFDQAAAIPLVGLTSYQALHDLMALQPGQKVLIQAGAGGIGTLAIQLAKELGAFVATTTSQRNFAHVKALGADRVIDYHTEDFATVLHDYDAVFDTLGGRALEQAFQIVKPGGQVVSLSGIPDGRFAAAYGLPRWKQGLLRLASHRLTRLAHQAQADYHFLFMHPSHTQLEILTRLIEQERLHPVIDHVYPFSQLNQALTYARAGHAHGKIIISFDA
ncbi:NADP-dependent oxidoreductase [Levilactobacillus enshiensis]|uniref:NADP-dependent oxidoreductase n=1 Tax=Levilactobacillus enshiensis TaxID=2590213 RepID=UPI00117A7D78|nr:NADP-dependent oxidoreductase [Levilactobacillus enshiensis]